MRASTISAALLWASGALCFDQQVPLNTHPLSPSPSDDAPSYRGKLLELHKALVSISSISGLEMDIGYWLAEYFYEKGWTSISQTVPPRENTPAGHIRRNVMAWPSHERQPHPKVLLTSHIDTVPPYIPYSIEYGEITKDTRINGRGSVDAKASIATMIVAIDELLDANKVTPDDVMLAFVVGEEVSGDGMRSFNEFIKSEMESVQPDAVIFGEPTEKKLACGHKGALYCGIQARGQGGHSGYPWLGKSANEVLVRAMARILDADLGSSERFGNTTVNIGLMEGGVAQNVIPEHAFAGLMVRVALGPQETGGKIVKDRIQAILDEVDDEAFTFDCSQGYGFVETNWFETVVVNYGTDVPHLTGDFTKYLYGPGTILVAHGPQENITVGDLEAAVEDYQKLILHSLEK
ncbi:hypothetical protein ACO1O0_002734 [Amphichorda felina]